jgi:hypothetical protein
MVSPVRDHHRRFQAETPLIALCRFAGPALYLSFLIKMHRDFMGLKGHFAHIAGRKTH